MYARKVANENSGSPSGFPLEPSAGASCWTVAKNSGLWETVERISYIRFRWDRTAGPNEGIDCPVSAADVEADTVATIAIVPCLVSAAPRCAVRSSVNAGVDGGRSSSSSLQPKDPTTWFGTAYAVSITDPQL